MFFPSGNAEEFCDHVFRTFDMDKNGYIDFKVSKARLRSAKARLIDVNQGVFTPTRASSLFFCLRSINGKETQKNGNNLRYIYDSCWETSGDEKKVRT